MTDAEMTDAAAEEEQLPPLHFEALQFVKISQSQHGLRHNDYPRYRQHCTKKAQRLRKTLKLQQGRGKFVRKQLELSQVSSIGHLQLPLVSAERSWAFAMEAKGNLDSDHAAIARQHMLRRLAKAAKHAGEFARFATARGTARTALEAEAYAAHISGLHLIEHSARRAQALAKLLTAQRLCQELSKVGSFEQQAVAQQRLDEIEPVVRFAKYQLSQSGADPAEEPALSNLKEKLSALQSEAKDAPASAATASSGPVYLQWRGATYAVFGEKLKACVTRAAELEPSSEIALQQGSPEEQAAALEGLIAAFSEAKGIVRHSLATGSGSGAEAADAVADMKALDTAVTGKQLELVIRRNQLLAAQAEARLADSLPTDAAVKAKRAGRGKKSRGQGPSAIVRLYDNLMGNVKDLTETASQLGGAAGEYLLDECNAKAAELRARRCFFLGRSYLADGKPLEARALFARTAARVAEAVERHEECASPDTAALKALEDLRAQAGAWGVVAQAKALSAEEAAEEGIKKLDIGEDDEPRLPVEYLEDDLGAWRSFAGGEGEEPRLAPIPPRLEAVPMRPIMLDCALAYVAPPDLSHRLPKEEKKSAIGRLFGWGAAK